MRVSRRMVAATSVALVVLFSVALVTEMSHRYQVLPFSSWVLFHKRPPQSLQDYGIRINSIDGVALTPPVYFESSGLPNAASPTAYETGNSVGRALVAGDELRAAVAFEFWAGRFLQGHDAEVEIVQRRYDVLEKRDCECYDEENVIGTETWDRGG